MPKGRQVDAAAKCAEIAVRQAEKAKGDGTFGVGGLLLDHNRIIVKIIRNRVIRNGSVHDPTAHVERQLVDWYYSKNMPPAGKMTIVTSLDPCLMCCGAILAGGLDVIHVSQDSEAGVSCRGPGDFSTLPAGLQQKARKAFSAFGVAEERPFSGPRNSVFYGSKIGGDLNSRSVHAFSSSLKKVKEIVSNHHGLPPDDLANPRLAKSPRIFRLLKKYNPRVFSSEYRVSFDSPGIDVGRILIQKARRSFRRSGVFNSACLIDPFGNVLVACGSGSRPAMTPFMELVRKYHRLLAEAGAEGGKHFAHLKHCKTVLLYGPGQGPKSLMDLGCFGSAIQGELPQGRQMQYVIAQQRHSDLQRMLDNLPPLYSKVVRMRDAVWQADDPELLQFCNNEASKIKP